MEIQVSGISNIILKPGSKIEFGRGSGLVTDDRTVSRHHVAFELPLTISDQPKVRFEVCGRNPIWVHDSKSSKVNTFTSTQNGEMEAGDKFCVSAKNPIWFTLRKAGFGGQREDKGEIELGFEEKLVSICELIDGEDLELESVDTSSIDPVKEFGFLVLGHEFDRYPKKMIRNMNDWDWFIEEPVVNSEDDDEYQKRKKNSTRKRKKGDENDDDEWTAESEEEKMQITGSQKVPKPKYTTRSKNLSKSGNDGGKDLQLKQKSSVTNQSLKDEEDDEDENEDDEDENEDDQTLGGFIVDDEFENEEESDDNEDEEEEELEEEDNEDE